ncbi:MAG: membrane protein of unknown function [Promethearchaeota archaeon]|nr:MAG: membrane protein of unknown function [Candidatus Lokiarchaeota archaeon]
MTGGVADVIIVMNSILFAMILFFLKFTLTILISVFLFVLSFFGIFIFSEYMALFQYFKNYFELENETPPKLLLKKHYISIVGSGILIGLMLIFILLQFSYYSTSDYAIYLEVLTSIVFCFVSIIWIIGFRSLRT